VTERDHTLGSALRQARMAEGIGVRELARRSGLDPSQISRIESGKVEQPEYPTIRALGKALGRPSLALAVLAEPDFDGGSALLASISDGEIAALHYETNAWVPRTVKALRSAFQDYEGWEPAVPQLMAFAHDLFVHVTIAHHLEVLEQSAFADDMSDIQQLVGGWRALTLDRQRLVSDYVADQTVLSDLDRRGRNPKQAEPDADMDREEDAR